MKKVITCITTIGMGEALAVQLALQDFIQASATTYPLDIEKAYRLKQALQAAGAHLHDTSVVDFNQTRNTPRKVG